MYTAKDQVWKAVVTRGKRGKAGGRKKRRRKLKMVKTGEEREDSEWKRENGDESNFT